MATSDTPPPSPTDPAVVRFSDCVPQPGANGGGVTRVLALGHLPGSSATFDWRLSVADVTSGPFSILPGVDRVITLTDGPGLTLIIDENEIVLEPFRPLPFAGESLTRCETSEPTLDFNVMTRRAACSAEVAVCLGSGFVAAPLGCVSYVVALKGSTTVRLRAIPPLTLNQFDTVCLPTAAGVRVRDGGRIAVVRIRPLVE